MSRTFDEIVMQSFGLTTSTETAKRYMRNYFNPYNRVMVDMFPSFEFSYIFMTRPELNLFGASTGKSIDLPNMVNQDRDLAEWLDLKEVSEKGPFLIPMMNYLTEMSVSDVEFDSKSSPANAHNIRINYPTNYEKSLAGVPINLTFQDNKTADILKFLNLWTTYMSEVSLGRIEPRADDILKNKFESSISIYQFVTAEDGETLKFFAKWIGCYPNNLPFSNYAHKKIRNELEPISVSFYAPFVKMMRPSILVEFNRLVNFKNADEIKRNQFFKYNPSNKDIDDYFMDGVCIIKENNYYKIKFYNNKNMQNLGEEATT
ncbi:MAG: hypothetical protein ACOCRK_03170 [bacterium]